MSKRGAKHPYPGLHEFPQVQKVDVDLCASKRSAAFDGESKLRKGVANRPPEGLLPKSPSGALM